MIVATGGAGETTGGQLVGQYCRSPTGGGQAATMAAMRASTTTMRGETTANRALQLLLPRW